MPYGQRRSSSQWYTWQTLYPVLRGLGEELQDFGNAGRPLRIAQNDGFRDILVVPFRVNDTKLVPVLSQALQGARGEGGLTAPRGAGEEHVHPIRTHPHCCAALLGTEHDVMACEPGLVGTEVVCLAALPTTLRNSRKSTGLVLYTSAPSRYRPVLSALFS